MPGIGNAIGIPFKKGAGISWSSYWSSLISATVENAAPTNVVLTFPSAKPELVSTDFTVTVNAASIAVNSASWAGAVLTLVINDTIIYGDVIVVTFVVTGGTVNVTNNVALDANASAFITAAGLTNETQKAAVNELVIDLKAINATQANFVNFATPASSILRAVYPLLGGTATSQKWNLIDPQDADGSFRIVWLNDHDANHTANGYEPNGTDQAGDTKLVPSVSLTEDSTHFAVYPYSDVAEDKYDMGAITAAGNWGLGSRTATDTIYNIQYNGLDTQPASYSSVGFFIGTRLSNTELNTFLNGGKIYRQISADLKTLPNVSVWLGAYNYTTPAYASKKYGFASIGAGIIDDAAYLYDVAVYKYMLRLGRITSRERTPNRAGIAFSIDDYSNNVDLFLTTGLGIGWIRCYGIKPISYIELSSFTAPQIANVNLLLAQGIELGTHRSILPERHTQTPTEIWTNIIGACHNGIVNTFSVTPVSFANHDDVCEWDQDMADYLVASHGYTNVREIFDTGVHSPLYDGTNELNNCCFLYTGLIETWVALKSFIDTAITANTILLIGGHGGYSLILQRAFAYAVKNNMNFYKTSELVPSLFA